MDIDEMYEKGIDSYTGVLTEKQYRDLFGAKVPHPFTGIDYVELYKSLGVNDNIEIYLSKDPRAVLDYTKEILVANIHDRIRTKNILLKAGRRRSYA